MWIKTKDFKPPCHEVILFQDRWRNEHYGVLCGDFSDIKKRNQYWCHIFQKSYLQKDIVYWCEIPINKNFLRSNNEFCFSVNQFLWETIQKIEKSIIEDFNRHLEENPEWKSEQFVGVAVRNTSWRIMEILRVTKDD